MPEISDKKLIKQYLHGDEKSLGFLIKCYLKPIYNFVYRYVSEAASAEDITQETFVKVWKNLNKFDQRKHFKTWIFCLAKNTAIDFLRKKKEIPFSEFEDSAGNNFLVENLRNDALLPEAILEQQDLAAVLSVVLKRLAPLYRTVLFLRHNDHSTFREIADQLGEPLNTVKSRYRRAIIALRRIIF